MYFSKTFFFTRAVGCLMSCESWEIFAGASICLHWVLFQVTIADAILHVFVYHLQLSPHVLYHRFFVVQTCLDFLTINSLINIIHLFFGSLSVFVCRLLFTSCCRASLYSALRAWLIGSCIALVRGPGAGHLRSTAHLCCYRRPSFVGLYLRCSTRFRLFPFLATQSWSFSELPFQRLRAKTKKTQKKNKTER